jgi:hypothetical protein
MATRKDEYTELADMNHNLNDELNTAKDQNERLEQRIIKYESNVLPDSGAQLKEALDMVRRHDEMVGSISNTIPKIRRTHSGSRKSTRCRQSAKIGRRAC